jgi:hypothetical protein
MKQLVVVGLLLLTLTLTEGKIKTFKKVLKAVEKTQVQLPDTDYYPLRAGAVAVANADIYHPTDACRVRARLVGGSLHPVDGPANKIPCMVGVAMVGTTVYWSKSGQTPADNRIADVQTAVRAQFAGVTVTFVGGEEALIASGDNLAHAGLAVVGEAALKLRAGSPDLFFSDTRYYTKPAGEYEKGNPVGNCAGTKLMSYFLTNSITPDCFVEILYIPNAHPKILNSLDAMVTYNAGDDVPSCLTCRRVIPGMALSKAMAARDAAAGPCNAAHALTVTAQELVTTATANLVGHETEEPLKNALAEATAALQARQATELEQCAPHVAAETRVAQKQAVLDAAR